MSQVKWIKLTTGMFEDEKVDFIESLPEADAILVIWVKLLTQAGKCNSNGFIFLTEEIPYTEEMLAHKFRRPLSVVRLALSTFKNLGMINIDEAGYLKLANWEKHQNVEGLDKIREQTRERVKFITTLDLLDEIKGTYNRESSLSENELISAIKEVDVLILDDIGVEGDTPWVQEKLYSILNGRMISKKITIFTSNSRVEELKQDERIKNRLEMMAIPIKMPEQSVRTGIAKQENKELQDILFA